MELELDEVIENLEYLVSDSCTDTQFDYVEEIEIATKSFKSRFPKKCRKNILTNIYVLPVEKKTVDAMKGR